MPVSLTKPSDLVVAAAEAVAADIQRAAILARTARLAELTDAEVKEQYATFRRRAEEMTRRERAIIHAQHRNDLVGLTVADVMRERREFG
ncbi:hypothetical protein HHL19_35805 [Streptomyces sp. R302]|uniref:hypothetical protein n=1 Tax=unclassified Streptomyces TaxID=2593676 RepID=UPI00145C4ACD|nr:MULTISPECIES: hypothetical protein [unclassified Streptomyces]NML55094.1 hypothetical protein [Streptomyces sp. R301]NML83876.1 hypothetical protein [Streptomyces sp. R302]